MNVQKLLRSAAFAGAVLFFAAGFLFFAVGSSQGPSGPETFHIPPTSVRANLPVSVRFVLKGRGWFGTSGSYTDIRVAYIDGKGNESPVDEMELTKGMQTVWVDAVLPAVATNGKTCQYILYYTGTSGRVRHLYDPVAVTADEVVATP